MADIHNINRDRKTDKEKAYAYHDRLTACLNEVCKILNEAMGEGIYIHFHTDIDDNDVHFIDEINISKILI